MRFSLVEKRPADCTDIELGAFCDLIKKGDEVDPHGLEGRVRRAWLIAFGSADGRLAAVAGIKKPDKDYRAGVFRKSESKLEPEQFAVELGWVMVEEEFRRRGLGRRVMDALLGSLNQNVYTTSRSTNEPMHALLTAYGFAHAGNRWRSTRGPYDLVLHVMLV